MLAAGSRVMGCSGEFAPQCAAHDAMQIRDLAEVALDGVRGIDLVEREALEAEPLELCRLRAADRARDRPRRGRTVAGAGRGRAGGSKSPH